MKKTKKIQIGSIVSIRDTHHHRRFTFTGVVVEEKRYTGAKWIVYWFDLKHTIPHYPEHIFRI